MAFPRRLHAEHIEPISPNTEPVTSPARPCKAEHTKAGPTKPESAAPAAAAPPPEPSPKPKGVLETLFSPVFVLLRRGIGEPQASRPAAVVGDAGAGAGPSSSQPPPLMAPLRPSSRAELASSEPESFITWRVVEEEDDESSEEEFADFDAYAFIRSLPPLEQCVPKYRKTLLPRQTRRGKQKTLVLDLDETLVHSQLRPVADADFTFYVEVSSVQHVVNVRRRPHLQEVRDRVVPLLPALAPWPPLQQPPEFALAYTLRRYDCCTAVRAFAVSVFPPTHTYPSVLPRPPQFMERVSSMFEVVVFTASQRVYAEALLNIVDPGRRFIKHRVFRDSCVLVDGNYLKDLTVLGRDLAHTAIIDNSPQAFGFQVRARQGSGAGRVVPLVVHGTEDHCGITVALWSEPRHVP